MRNLFKAFIWAVLVVPLFFSCSKHYAEFGKLTFKKNLRDSIYNQQSIARIKQTPNAIFEEHSFTGKNNIALKYRLFNPKSGKLKLPLVIVFHGSNAIGNDNNSQLGILAKLFASPGIQSKYKAIVLAPQFPTRSSNYAMDEGRKVLTSLPQDCLQSLLELVDLYKKNPAVDPQRIYLVGFSMGGSSVINSLSLRPDLFAAGISISGIPQFDHVLQLAEMPIWLIHGNADSENPIGSDVQFYKEMNTKNNTRFWEYENIGHNDIFNYQLLGSRLPEWLFKQKK